MENIKEIILPDGWMIDKVENSKIILKEDDSKPIIKWNNEKNGVEVKADGYHFIVASMPTNIRSDYDSAKIICEKWDSALVQKCTQAYNFDLRHQLLHGRA